MALAAFDHVETWIFDLDNTLYPADCHLFAQIDERMTGFIEGFLRCDRAKARHLQKDYYRRYGTTLAGLMAEHNLPPDDFLDYVHDIDLSAVPPNERLGMAIAALPGRKYIFTNGSEGHAERVSDHLGVSHAFDGVFGIETGDFIPKPQEAAYHAFSARFGRCPRSAAFFEDMAPNLTVPAALGMVTILVQSDATWFEDEPQGKRPAIPGDHPPHVDHTTSDLTDFVGRLSTFGSNGKEGG
ncbi:putative haloacid dehalogenase superfamily hydrolase [Parvularcula bermudensis HTCC2503]|uniref:Putative haloacid dehalogenase superfamily hydrolase n=1 Tax=Parvularcula bermudensis (strain ATCC BAA-594 / HTCC2503 / KCTC 12087) TaxID=314260 RepID=E0TE46_PARBH|nr:pyrimidine 5'-nucleotidase [Parvularcula bermudensis]ADM08867.1 putative haloacid dehalogenase superfamily hydrolase [Parvularcula bermudensis HTCC2503]